MIITDVCKFWVIIINYFLSQIEIKITNSKVLIFPMIFLILVLCDGCPKRNKVDRCKPNELKTLAIHYISIICSRYVLSSEWWENLPN